MRVPVIPFVPLPLIESAASNWVVPLPVCVPPVQFDAPVTVTRPDPVNDPRLCVSEARVEGH